MTRIKANRALLAGLISGPQLGVLTAIASIGAAGAFLARAFGMRGVLEAVMSTNISVLAAAVIVGAVIQVVRAERARRLLAHDVPVTLHASYAAMVVSHGLGDLLPLAPAGPLLRSVLTERLSRVPMAFSAAIFMLEGMLDGVGPALLIGYLLLTIALPASMRLVLLGALIPPCLAIVIPALVLVLERSSAPAWCRPSGKVKRLIRQLADGLASLMRRGPRAGVEIIGLSLLITALSAVQSALFLNALGLAASLNHLLLLLVLTLTAGSIPIKLPGTGTLATSVVLPIAGIHGVGVAGFILVTRFVASTETPLLAAAVLGWWSISGHRHLFHLGDVFSKARVRMEPGAMSPEGAS